MKVFCYRNLNRKGVAWSVRSRRTGLVVTVSRKVYIVDAKLVVSQAGRRRVLKEQRRNVHAGVKGRWANKDFGASTYDTRDSNGCGGLAGKWVKVSYNPYKSVHFFRCDTLKAVNEADLVILDETGAWALNPRWRL